MKNCSRLYVNFYQAFRTIGKKLASLTPSVFNVNKFNFNVNKLNSVTVVNVNKFNFASIVNGGPTLEICVGVTWRSGSTLDVDERSWVPVLMEAHSKH